jgi:hypothetical protein
MMERGKVYALDSEKDEYADWKYFRVLNAITEENMANKENPTIGAKMYLVGNVLRKAEALKVDKKKEKVIKNAKVPLGDMIEMMVAHEMKEAVDTSTAVLLLTQPDF